MILKSKPFNMEAYCNSLPQGMSTVSFPWQFNKLMLWNSFENPQFNCHIAHFKLNKFAEVMYMGKKHPCI